MNLSVLRWLCVILIIGVGAADDMPFVFSENSSGTANYTSDQLKNISASSPELAGVPSISSPPDNEILTFPGNNDTTNGKTYRTVGELKKTFNSKAWQEKGLVFFNLGKYEEALQAFDRAFELNPKNAANLNSKGVVLARLGRYDDAIKCFDKAIWQKPSYVVPWLNKAKALGALGKYQDAIKACDRAIELDSKYAMAWYSRGQILKAEAEAAFAKASKLGILMVSSKCYQMLQPCAWNT
jgi:tetratricopeptide (TPR) repeat protein